MGADATILRERRSDGTVAVTLVRGGSAGADVGFGADVALKLGGRSLGFGGEIRALGLAGLGGGRTWVVPDDAAADRLVARLGERRSPSSAWCVACSARTRRSASRLHGQRGVHGRQRPGKLGTGRFGAEADMEVRDAVGTRTERATQAHLLHPRESGGSRGILLARPSAPSQAWRRDAGPRGHRRPRAALRSSCPRPPPARSTLSRGMAAAAGPDRRRRALGGRRAAGPARPRQPAAVGGFLAALRRPDRLSELVGTAQALGDRMRDYSDLQARRYRVDTQRTGAEGRVKVVGGLGARFERALESARLVGAWERPPGGVWQPRLDCVPKQATA